MLHLVLERAAHRKENDRDQSRPEVPSDIREDLVAGRGTEHQVEQDDVRPPIDRSVMRRLAVADGHALEPSPLEHALDQPEHLVVVVDHEHELAAGRSALSGGGHPGVFGLSRDGHGWLAGGSESGTEAGGRRSFSVNAIARSAATRTSWMSARTASGSPVSSAMSSQ